ncbi:hypothetical protein LINPERHAP2_LOCUS7746 [Linum perenne]
MTGFMASTRIVTNSLLDGTPNSFFIKESFG